MITIYNNLLHNLTFSYLLIFYGILINIIILMFKYHISLKITNFIFRYIIALLYIFEYFCFFAFLKWSQLGKEFDLSNFLYNVKQCIFLNLWFALFVGIYLLTLFLIFRKLQGYFRRIFWTVCFFESNFPSNSRGLFKGKFKLYWSFCGICRHFAIFLEKRTKRNYKIKTYYWVFRIFFFLLLLIVIFLEYYFFEGILKYTYYYLFFYFFLTIWISISLDFDRQSDTANNILFTLYYNHPNSILVNITTIEKYNLQTYSNNYMHDYLLFYNLILNKKYDRKYNTANYIYYENLNNKQLSPKQLVRKKHNFYITKKRKKIINNKKRYKKILKLQFKNEIQR